MAGITAIQSNAMPASGIVSQQPVPPNVAPGDIAQVVEYLTPAIQRFREQSSPLTAPLTNTKALSFADSDQVRIASVGLGYKLLLQFTGTITLVNSLTVASAAVNFSSKFPFNLIRSLQVQINGGAMVYSAGGLASIQASARKRRGFWLPNSTGGFGLGLPPAEVIIQTTNATVTNAALNSNQLSGITSLTVNASATATITMDFYVIVKLALDEDSLVGALPLQNNSTFATLTVNTVATLTSSSATNDSFPFFNVAGTTTVGAMALTCKPTYKFWSVPADPGLYQELVSNSYQVQEQPNNTASATGTTALLYNIPQNQYLVALHLNATDNGGVAVPMSFKSGGTQGISRFLIQYNAGGVIPVNEDPNRYRAEQYRQYGCDLGWVTGYLLWDGEATAEHPVNGDQAGWIDTYAAATPQFAGDIGSTISTPVTFSVTRESIVAGAVQVIGG